MRKSVNRAISAGAVLFCGLIFCGSGIVSSNGQQPAAAVEAKDDGLALTPPMGWYPWNTFGQEPQNETLVKEIADALVASGMKGAGYAYVGPDEGICFYRDDGGKLTTNLKRYPSGLRGLGDDIHAKGLKYALYTDAGSRTCSTAMPGTKGHEFDDMKSFAEWRADYVKIDWCNTEGMEPMPAYALLHKAQLAAGRPIVHSLCSWGDGSPWLWAAPVGHLWRTTSDICEPGKAEWGLAMKMAFANEKLYPWAGPGHWNDPDMMIAGMPGLSEAQNRSFFSLWCMMAAPLMAGNDLRDMTKSTVDILTNLEAIGINQDPLGVQGHIIRRSGAVSLWAAKPLFDGSQAVLLYNQGTSREVVEIKLAEVGIDGKAVFYVRDLWAHVTGGPSTSPEGTLSVSVPPNDVKMLRISKSDDFPLPPIIVADSYRVSVRAVGPTGRKLSGTITVTNKGSAELPLWKVKGNLPAWLTVSVTRDVKNQTFTNTIMTAGLKRGMYHAVVRADNIEPVSGKPMSAIYYDVDLEIEPDVRGPVK